MRNKSTHTHQKCGRKCDLTWLSEAGPRTRSARRATLPRIRKAACGTDQQGKQSLWRIGIGRGGDIDTGATGSGKKKNCHHQKYCPVSAATQRRTLAAAQPVCCSACRRYLHLILCARWRDALADGTGGCRRWCCNVDTAHTAEFPLLVWVLLEFEFGVRERAGGSVVRVDDRRASSTCHSSNLSFLPLSPAVPRENQSKNITNLGEAPRCWFAVGVSAKGPVFEPGVGEDLRRARVPVGRLRAPVLALATGTRDADAPAIVGLVAIRKITPWTANEDRAWDEMQSVA